MAVVARLGDRLFRCVLAGRGQIEGARRSDRTRLPLIVVRQVEPGSVRWAGVGLHEHYRRAGVGVPGPEDLLVRKVGRAPQDLGRYVRGVEHRVGGDLGVALAAVDHVPVRNLGPGKGLVAGRGEAVVDAVTGVAKQQGRLRKVRLGRRVRVERGVLRLLGPVVEDPGGEGVGLEAHGRHDDGPLHLVRPRRRQRALGGAGGDPGDPGLDLRDQPGIGLWVGAVLEERLNGRAGVLGGGGRLGVAGLAHRDDLPEVRRRHLAERREVVEREVLVNGDGHRRLGVGVVHAAEGETAAGVVPEPVGADCAARAFPPQLILLQDRRLADARGFGVQPVPRRHGVWRLSGQIGAGSGLVAAREQIELPVRRHQEVHVEPVLVDQPEAECLGALVIDELANQERVQEEVLHQGHGFPLGGQDRMGVRPAACKRRQRQETLGRAGWRRPAPVRGSRRRDGAAGECQGCRQDELEQQSRGQTLGHRWRTRRSCSASAD